MLMKNVRSIAVVGGGTAGFVAALILKSRYPTLKIDIIKSEKIGIVGVGEGSTEHWNEFMKYIGVSHRQIIKYCGATFKTGIMFQNWNKHDYLHSTHADFEKKTGQYNFIYARQIAKGLPQKSMTLSNIWKNELDVEYLESETPPFNQYHFNTRMLNDFLHRVSLSKNIEIFDDEIMKVNFNMNEEIESLRGNKKTYSYDFYIDATGFHKLLIGKIGAKWNSYSKWLKMKSAIVFPTEPDEEYNLWTIAKALKYGWMFRIPVQGRYGNGYIFDSDYITADQAKQEVENVLGKNIEIGKHINFDPGALENVWIKNCCAIGLSASFVEPLEASSIGSSIQQTFLLMHRLPNYDQRIIDSYNKDVRDILENIRDFVLLHYLTDKKDSNFWKDISQIELPDSLNVKLERWKHNLPIEEDFNNITKYIMFRENNFIHVLHGLNHFNKASIEKEYRMQHPEIHKLTEKYLEDIRIKESLAKTIGHKKYIEITSQL
jgi:tryptophan 6-halogenase